MGRFSKMFGKSEEEGGRPKNIEELLGKALVVGGTGGKSPFEGKGAMPQDLREAYHRLTNPPRRFEQGQVVRWKEGMRNKRVPKEGDFAVVVEHLEEPRFDVEANGGSAQFFEPLDLILGVIDDDGDFILYHFDSRRFEPIE